MRTKLGWIGLDLNVFVKVQFGSPMEAVALSPSGQTLTEKNKEKVK